MAAAFFTAFLTAKGVPLLVDFLVLALFLPAADFFTAFPPLAPLLLFFAADFFAAFFAGDFLATAFFAGAFLAAAFFAGAFFVAFLAAFLTAGAGASFTGALITGSDFNSSSSSSKSSSSEETEIEISSSSSSPKPSSRSSG
ncbi:hypothetical protein [Silvibacterium sp.]|uniref:hypothetical protein n=1 Tax=Silvibacterium sp. TaxID=1964179 RepID=UPI0039E6B72D